MNNNTIKPGVYPDISNADYHGGPGTSKSGLDVIHRSAQHFKAMQDAVNDNEERVPTPAQALGDSFHQLVLEPEVFAQNHVLPFVAPEGALATVEDIKARLKHHGLKLSGAKAELVSRLLDAEPDAIILDALKGEHARANAGRRIVPQSEWDQLHAMRDSVMTHPAAGKLFSAPGVVEHSVYWNDPATGELCRCRPDFWRQDDIIVDLKTTEDASPDEFSRSVAKWRYHVQDSFYSDGVKLATGRPVKAFVFVAVEKKPPYAVAVYRLDEASRELGREEYRRDLDTLAECHRTNVWPGYGDKINTLGVPNWYALRAAS